MLENAMGVQFCTSFCGYCPDLCTTLLRSSLDPRNTAFDVKHNAQC